MSTAETDYQPSAIEPKWQDYWQTNQTFHAENGATTDKGTFYVLDMFPYPSGSGLHIGHPEGYTATDALKRFKKAQGYAVLHPMGWDAFGLPTEQFAIKTGEPPAVVTKRNIARFKAQLKLLGFAYDWDREVNTTDPDYYRWTQWIFLQLFKHGLAYVDEKPVWFCPDLGTVLANEEVLNMPEGPRSERGNFPVERRPIRQWVLRITEYADRLLEGLENVNWPESTKALQTNWIGKSTGAEVRFAVADVTDADGQPCALDVFTTRPDTLHGATYMVVAPEHPLLDTLTSPAQREAVNAYVEQAKRKSDLERAELAKEKTGVATGAYAINPVNGQRIPIWVADYVLITYGTGAIMAVPAHDQRDFEFAQTFDLAITQVIAKAGESADAKLETAYTGDGLLVNSGELNGLSVAEAKTKIIAQLEAEGRGKATVNYKLRDWLFSRQRYWGEPFPIVWVKGNDYYTVETHATFKQFFPQTQISGAPASPVTCRIDGERYYAVPLPESTLPLTLPHVEDYQPSPDGQSPLAKNEAWVHVWLNVKNGEIVTDAEYQARKSSADDGWIASHYVAARRETNTMPQWAGSCWYYLRYMDPKNASALVSEEAEAYWKCPDLYVGGAEHAVLHLLYARFWHLFLKDIGVLKTPEPFTRLFHQGIILGEDGEKMSKSRGNVVNPDDIIAEHGADALRCYLMFLGPLEQMKPWNTENIKGVSRFLRDVWRLVVASDGSLNEKLSSDRESVNETEKLLHQTIQKVTDDYEKLSFNTAISQMMIFKNHLHKAPAYRKSTVQTIVQLLAPLAPHLAEELWERLGMEASVHEAPWPEYDATKLVETTMTLPVQVTGKVRGELTVAKETPKDEVLAAAKQLERVAANLEGKTIVKAIYVPGKIINFVAK